jgi:hypothetical protein
MVILEKALKVTEIRGLIRRLDAENGAPRRRRTCPESACKIAA